MKVLVNDIHELSLRGGGIVSRPNWINWPSSWFTRVGNKCSL